MRVVLYDEKSLGELFVGVTFSICMSMSDGAEGYPIMKQVMAGWIQTHTIKTSWLGLGHISPPNIATLVTTPCVLFLTDVYMPGIQNEMEEYPLAPSKSTI